MVWCLTDGIILIAVNVDGRQTVSTYTYNFISRTQLKSPQTPAIILLISVPITRVPYSQGMKVGGHSGQLSWFSILNTKSRTVTIKTKLTHAEESLRCEKRELLLHTFRFESKTFCLTGLDLIKCKVTIKSYWNSCERASILLIHAYFRRFSPPWSVLAVMRNFVAPKTRTDFNKGG